jgi:hypothetical protein
MPIFVWGFVAGFCLELSRQLKAMANDEELPEETLPEVVARGFVDGALQMLNASLKTRT